MHAPLLPTTEVLVAKSATRLRDFSAWVRSRFHAALGGLIAGSLLLSAARAEDAQPRNAPSGFSDLVKLSPFVVNGQQLSISVYARTNSDRRYAEEFSEAVAKVVYDSVTDSLGKGLVIIGQKGEPHPIFVFRKFLALAQDGKLDPAIAARGPELSTMLDHWQHSLQRGKSGEKDKEEKDDHDDEFDFDKIVTALPLPLEGIGAKLYQLAWEEKFDYAKVEARLRVLHPEDLERRDLFARFDWVFYLPPKGVFERVLDEVIADALKKEDLGFFARTAVKGALLVVKPKIRQAIEGMRKGMMFMTVVQARTHYPPEEVWALTDAYMKTFMPGQKSTPGTPHERAVKAVRDQLQRNRDKPKAVEEPAPVADAANASAR